MRLSLRAVFVEEAASQILKGERLLADFPSFAKRCVMARRGAFEFFRPSILENGQQ